MLCCDEKRGLGGKISLLYTPEVVETCMKSHLLFSSEALKYLA